MKATNRQKKLLKIFQSNFFPTNLSRSGRMGNFGSVGSQKRIEKNGEDTSIERGILIWTLTN